MAAKSSWHRYGTKLRHCHPRYTHLAFGHDTKRLGIVSVKPRYRGERFWPAAVNMSRPTLAMRRRGPVSPAERGVLSVFRGRAAAFRNHISYRLRSVTGTALGRARTERKCAENCDKRHSKVS